MIDNGFHWLCMSNIIRILAGSEIAKYKNRPPMGVFTNTNGGIDQRIW